MPPSNQGRRAAAPQAYPGAGFPETRLAAFDIVMIMGQCGK